MNYFSHFHKKIACNGFVSCLFYSKLQILWESHKIWQNIPPFFGNYLVPLKQIGIFFQIFVAFSEYLNFNEYKMSTITELLGYLQRPCFDPLCIEKKMTSFFPIKPQSMTHIHSGFALQFQSCGVSWLRTKVLVIK